MCGVLGGISTSSRQLDLNRIKFSLSAIKHRGPDDLGVEIENFGDKKAFLGHTRLSIIDLSEAGHQPMYNDDRSIAVVFNGEIYNYIELREQLKSKGVVFKTDTDTEVLLQSWAYWGESALRKFVGMFAFSIFDFRSKEVHCYRDAFGIKPFYYYIDNDEFSFASEIKPLLRLRDELPGANFQRCYDYLVFGDYDSNHETFFDGIFQLEPGQSLSVKIAEDGLLEYSKRYWWSAKDIKPRGLSYDEAVQEVKEEFLNSVKLHLRSDVSLGVALSGGLDSSAIVCAIKSIDSKQPIQTFSFIADDEELSEEHWVDKVNDFVSAQSHKVRPSSDELLDDLDAMIEAQGEPFGSTSIYAQYRVFKLAREKGIVVTLDGQGADELLGGYDGFPEQRIIEYLKRFRFLSAFKFLRCWSKWPRRSFNLGLLKLTQALLPNFAYGFLRDLSGKSRRPKWLNLALLKTKNVRFEEERKTNVSKGKRGLNGFLKQNLSKRSLPSLLRHADRNSMSFSIESRVPFLTIPLAELLLSLDSKYLVSDEGQTKNIFRDALKDIVPEEILFRKDKVGFVTSEMKWFSELSNKLELLLSKAAKIPILNSQEVENEFKLLLEGKRKFSWQYWRWINFIKWYDKFFIRKSID